MDHMTQIKELQKGLIAWYKFHKDADVLYVGREGDAICEFLMSKSGYVYDDEGNQVGDHLSVTVATLLRSVENDFCAERNGQFDYVICIGLIEKAEDPETVLRCWKRLLKPDGICLLGFNNRFGIRYFCGDRDCYTNRNFDGVENYRRAYMKSEDVFRGRMYAKFEIEQILGSEGFLRRNFYSVLSNLENPSHLLKYDYIPNEDLANRLYPSYYSPETVFLEEESLYQSLFSNGMFHPMANAYLVEAGCTERAGLSDVLQVTSSMERNHRNAMLTVIREDNTVEKKPAYPEGAERINRMLSYSEDLRKHGLKTVEMECTDGSIRMPYMEAPTGQLYLKNLLRTDLDDFYQAMDRFMDLVVSSSVAVGGEEDDDLGLTLEYGYLDLVPLNSFYVNGDFVFFDQEFRKERFPANAIRARVITTLYFGNSELNKILPAEILYERYHLWQRIQDWREMEGRFLWELRSEGELWQYHQKVRRNADIVNSNRQRMNYTSDDYYRLFVDIFNHCDTRKLILFGSGRFAEQFMSMYREDYPVYAIVDNQEKRWGEELYGIRIQSPELLHRLSPGEFKVLVCIKNYISVMKQLEDMGVSEFSIYDPVKPYPKKRRPTAEMNVADGKKKYHVGYISGVFDLYHVGHLNLLRKAKSMCDYLIVGVVSDKGVVKKKGVNPFIPFDERVDLVRSCRFVDEVVEIPLEYNGPQEAFAMYHFDVQFSGSDYINAPYWLDAQKYLREHGADLVFLPYTKSTNSTNIKALIEKNLL
ncbi:MAG: adenylyltransferase/cytidyltransferase family protein [Lachnospiraceae bacterium]|nr:adenylyltransferase/cytidyltransferase family protein [Lachnospiraceae bacterium]